MYNYKHREKDDLFLRFINLTYNDKHSLKKLHNDYNVFISSNDDILLKKVLIVIEGLLILAESNDFEKATQKVTPLWIQLLKRNSLYIADLYIINAILFLFPLEIAIEIKKFAERNIDKYKNFHNIHRLKLNLTANIMLLFMKDNQFEMALQQVDVAIAICKQEQMYVHLAVFYTRKGICLNKTKENGNEWITRGQNMLSILEQESMKQLMNNEVVRYQ